ncbi:uncharacterized protein LOC130443214 [Diorhabda sublineata]|uniref:uncharacterized protein LOC130443214 n=1 Tax=Diorhabda sublineata TaxID=1163346 RepID=UPI0024E09F01|nr:uncharacterized protein LOC130443214 [Diorhabda sublineata]
MATRRNRNRFEEELFLEVDRHYFNYDLGEDNGDSLLVYGVLKALVEEDYDRVKSLVRRGQSININDSSGNTPLHVTVLKDNLEILEFLLSQPSVEVNNRNFTGETPLLIAIKCGNIKIAEKLIQSGANVNIPNYEEVTPLHMSVSHARLAHLLIKSGAYIDAKDYSGDTPLHDAVAEENLETVCMLLYYNADANVHGVNNLTPFMKAIISKNVEIQAVLIEYVDDFNIETYDNVTTLALAITNRTPFVEEIILGGADVNYAYGYDLIDPFALCLQYPNAKTFRLVWDRLIYNGDDMSLGSILWRISGTLRKDIFKQYVDVIIESDNINQAVESLNTAEDFYMVIVRFCDFFHQLSLDQLTKLTCRILTYGYNATSFDMSKIFLHYGYCELFRIMLHMDIKYIGRRPPDTSRLIYDLNYKMTDLLDQLVDVINIEYLHNTIYQILDYCIYPKLLIGYLQLERDDYVTFKILHLPKIPSLLELARNTAREYVVEKFKIKSSRQFYTIINYMNINKVYKKILTFEKKLYFPTYLYSSKKLINASE